MPHTFTHCSNLRNFYMEGCVLRRFTYTSIDLDRRTSIDEFSLEECIIYSEMFEDLSLFVGNINRLIVSLYIYRNNEDHQNNTYTPRPSIIAVWYYVRIMHKFSQLETLDLQFSPYDHHFDRIIFERLSTSAFRIDNLCLIGRGVNHANILELIGNNWRRLPAPVAQQNLTINYSEEHFEQKIGFAVTNRFHEIENSTTLNYSVNEDFDWRSLMEFLQENGSYIGSMRVIIFLNDFPFTEGCGLHEGLMLYIFAYCPNLQDLQFDECVLKRFSLSNLDKGKRFSINTLHLPGCYVDGDILEHYLSMLLSDIQHLHLSRTENYTKDELEVKSPANRPLEMTMPHTTIHHIIIEDPISTGTVYLKLFMPLEHIYQYFRMSKNVFEVINEMDYVRRKKSRISLIYHLSFKTIV